MPILNIRRIPINFTSAVIKPPFTRWAPLLALPLCLASCSEDIRLVAPGNPVPIVYAIFDVQDLHHHMLLSKSFAGEESLSDLLNRTGILHYDHARIRIASMLGGFAGEFTPVDSSGRQPGLFPEHPHRYYKYSGPIKSIKYRISIETGENDETLVADLVPLNRFVLLTPHPLTRTFYFYEDPTLFSWTPSPGSGMFQIDFILHYRDFLRDGTQHDSSFTHSVVLFPENLEWNSGTCSYRSFSDPFFGHLRRELTESPGVDYRMPRRFEIGVTCGDTILARYLKWDRQQVDGQMNPNGNIEGAIGLIASKYSIRIDNMKLSSRSQDSLVKGRYTKALNFTYNPEW